MKSGGGKSPPAPLFQRGGHVNSSAPLFQRGGHANPSATFLQSGEICIRSAVSKDRDAIRAIIDGAGNLTEAEEACAAELLDIYLKNAGQRDYSFIVAVDGQDAAVGYACYGPRPLTDGTYDLYWIIVDPAARRSGAGRALVEGVGNRLAALGARLIVAETSGLAKYEPTRRFYTGCGFIEEARVKEFYRAGDDLVIYTMRLRPYTESGN